MFQRLKNKWKVNGIQLILVLCTFAIGGSLCGYLGKKVMDLLAVSQDWLWTLIYIVAVTVIWPICVLVVSIPFGQFRFFTAYLRKIGLRFGLVKSREKNSKS